MTEALLTEVPPDSQEVVHAELDRDSRPGRRVPIETAHPVMPQTRRAFPAAPAEMTPPEAAPGAAGLGRSAEKDCAEARRVTDLTALAPAGPRPVRLPKFATHITYLAVLVLVVAGVYISWHQGSDGGGQGGVIAGVAFLLAAAVRFTLPARLSGLLASRGRTTDVVTLVIFGACLLVLGLVLPG